MKKYNLLNEIGKIDDEVIEKVYKIDNEEKLKEAKKAEKTSIFNIFKYISVGVVATCFLVLGVILINNNDNNNVTEYTPIIEVETLEEMNKYLGFIPKTIDKEIISYVIINDGENIIGEINYEDGSVYRVSKLKEDISGISGGVKNKSITILENEIDIYQMDDIVYAIWNDENYSYSYSVESSIDDLVEDLEELIEE